MSEMEYAFIVYFGILLLLLLFFPRSRFRKTEKTPEVKKDVDQDDNRTRVLRRDTDYIEEFGLVDLDREEIIDSELFKIMLQKVPRIEEQLESVQLFYDGIRKLRPYSMTDLFRIACQLREGEYAGATEAYKTHITASAIVYDFIIPKSLFNDDSVVLPYVAAHMRLHSPVSVFNEVQKYIREGSDHLTGLEVVEQHKQVTRLLEDMSFANVFLETVFKHEAFLGIEYLYERWLNQPAVNASNAQLYNQDIKYFKKLVTMYFGIMEVDVPKEYLYIDAAVCEYLLQIRRYDPSKAAIRVVDKPQ